LLLAEQVETGLNHAIEQSRLPVIAACNGHTLGGGAVLALACDIRLAASSARFGFPEVQLGAFASGSGTQRLPRLVGRGRALDLLLTGRTIDAVEAERIGLVEAVVPDADLLARALDLAEEIARQPAAAIAASKRCVVEGLRYGETVGLALELELSVATGLSADAVEGQRAFIEKRPPRFRSSR
jgi:enoyl-CoA hydratase/carnithine racemase